MLSLTLHNACLVQVETLLDHVQLHQATVALLLVRDQVQIVLMEAIHISDLPQPVFQQTQVLSGGRSSYGSAVIVACNVYMCVLHMNLGQNEIAPHHQ